MKKSVFVVISSLIILHFVLIGSLKSQTNDNNPVPNAAKGKAFDGYTLFQPLFGNTTYLINMDG